MEGERPSRIRERLRNTKKKNRSTCSRQKEKGRILPGTGRAVQKGKNSLKIARRENEGRRENWRRVERRCQWDQRGGRVKSDSGHDKKDGSNAED